MRKYAKIQRDERSHHLGCRNPQCGCGINCQCGENCSCNQPVLGQSNRYDQNEMSSNYNFPSLQDLKNRYNQSNQINQHDQNEMSLNYNFPSLQDLKNRYNRPNQSNQHNKQMPCTGLSDNTCKQVEASFKKFDKNASIFPGIGLPSQNNGVCTILHGMGPGAHNLKINGLESKSPLANAALFSTECSNGKYINLYEMMLPEGISKTPGEESNAERYAKELNQKGINVAGTHWHWWASDPYVVAIHHQNIGMNPVTFTNKTVDALTDYRNRMNSGNY